MMRVISLALLLRFYAAAQSPLTAGIEEYHQGRLRQAREHLETAVKQDPSNADAKAFLAMVTAASGECGSQQDSLVSMWKGQGASPATKRLAGLAALQCAITQKKPETGASLLAELEKAYPGDADVLYLGAKLYMTGWNEEIGKMFAQSASSYRVNQLSAEIFETQGNYAEAASEYAKAIQKNPSAINLHFRRGRVLLLASHEPAALEQAQKEFEAELALNAEDAAAEYQIGQILEARGDRDGAVKRFEKALALRPSFPEAMLAVAKSRLREKRNSDAIELLEKLVALQPQNEAAHYNLMLAYRNAGKASDAAREKEQLDQLQKSPAGEFSDFLKKLEGQRPKQ